MADPRMQQWLIQKGNETKTILVSEREAKDIRNQINREGWVIKASTYADTQNYQKAFEKQVEKTEFGGEGTDVPREIHEASRQQQILEEVITPAPQPQQETRVVSAIPEKGIAVSMPVSEEFRQKLEEIEPVLEHEASRAEQITKGIITPPPQREIVVTPALTPSEFKESQVKSYTSTTPTTSIQGNVVTTSQIPSQQSSITGDMTKIFTKDNKATAEEVGKAIEDYQSRIGKDYIEVFPVEDVNKAWYGRDVKNPTINIEGIAMPSKGKIVLPKDYYNAITEGKLGSWQTQDLLHHEVLHNLFPSASESEIVSMQSGTLKTLKGGNGITYVSPIKSDAFGVVNGAVASKGFYEKYMEAVKTPSVLSGQVSLAGKTEPASMTTTTTTTKPFTTTVKTDPKAIANIITTPTSSEKISSKGISFKTEISSSTISMSATNPLVEKFVQGAMKDTSEGKIIPSILTGFATRITPEDPFGIKSASTFISGVKGGKSMEDIKSELDKITEDSLRWWGEKTLTEKNELKPFGKYVIETVPKTSTGQLAIGLGASNVLSYGTTAFSGMLSSFSPAASEVFGTAATSYSAYEGLTKGLPLGAEIYEGYKSGDAGDFATSTGKIINIAGVVAGGYEGYKSAKKLFDPLPETQITKPPEGKEWAVKDASLKLEKIKGLKDFDVYKARYEIETVPTKLRSISTKDVYGGKYITEELKNSELLMTAGKFKQKTIYSPKEMDISKLSEGMKYESVVDIFPELKSPINMLQMKPNEVIKITGKDAGKEIIAESLRFESGGGTGDTNKITGMLSKTAAKTKTVLPLLKDLKLEQSKAVPLKITGVPGIFSTTEIYIGNKDTEKMVGEQNIKAVKMEKIKTPELKLPETTSYGKDGIKVSGVPGVFKTSKNVIEDLTAMYKDAKLEEELKKQGKTLESKTGIKSYEEALKVSEKSPMTGKITYPEIKTAKGTTKDAVASQFEKHTPIMFPEKATSKIDTSSKTGVYSSIEIKFSSEKLKYPSPYSAPKITEEEEYYISPPGSPAIQIPSTTQMESVLDTRYYNQPMIGQIITPTTQTFTGEIPSMTQASSFAEATRQNEISIIKQMQMQKPATRQIQIQRPIQENITRQIYIQRPTTATKQKTMLTQIQMQKPFSSTILMPPLLSSKTKKLKSSTIGKKAYSVLVRKGGKFVRIKLPPLTRRSALSLGAKITGETELASFKLEPTVGTPFRIKGEGFKPYMFRKPKGKSKLGKDVFIEKSKFRIDQPIELREITYKGIKASKQRAKKPNIPKFKFGKVKKNAFRL